MCAYVHFKILTKMEKQRMDELRDSRESLQKFEREKIEKPKSVYGHWGEIGPDFDYKKAFIGELDEWENGSGLAKLFKFS